MKNLWPESFDKFQISTPKEVLEDQAKLLPKLTGDLVYSEVAELNIHNSPGEIYDKSFRYGFFIRGKFLENYRYQLFSIGHNILIYPALMVLDTEISKELGLANEVITLDNEDQFIDILEKTLKTSRVGKIVSSIMSLSR